ncbi:hypothetical protein RND81_14G134400 [Saponaria officinalis]
MAACLNPALHNVVETLVELGANVNAYRSGHNGGTPLHHAAKRGLVINVNFLLLHGANALFLNDDCLTPLDIARVKGFTDVVRAIEDHICLYSGWLREPYGPGFLEVLAPQFLSRKVWAVVRPCGSRNLRKPFKLELAIYSSLQDAQPRMHIALWKANMEEPSFDRPDPAVIISQASTNTRIRLVPIVESDRQQLQQFCNACKGTPQVAHANFPFNNASSTVLPATAPPTNPPHTEDDLDLARAINASLQSALQQDPPTDHFQTSNRASPSNSTVQPPEEEVRNSATSAIPTDGTHTTVPTPSAPVITDEHGVLIDGPIHYPTVYPNAMDTSSSCVICFDAPLEAACVPCGHMAGCVSCLSEIKSRSGECPVCRTMIDHVMKVYTV